jgi:hydrogenase/urease accessory protein HupE
VSPRSLWRVIAPALTALALLAPVARAHEPAFSHVTLHWSGAHAGFDVTLHPKDAGGAPLPGIVERGLHVSADGHPLALRLVRTTPAPERHGVTLAFVAAAPHAIGRLEVDARLFPQNNLHETFFDAYVDGRLVRQEMLTAERPGVELYDRGPAGWVAVARTFIAAGTHHVFIGPDHILFIVGLLLASGGLARVLKIATAFTLAHSITLALAATGHVNVPTRIVEPLIAASIVYVGVENLWRRGRGRDHRIAMAFGFGLVHGLGFASVLRELGLPREAFAGSLVAFNGGIEIAQAAIVLAVTPVIGLLRARRPQLAWRVVAFASCGVIVAGGFWLVQRVLAAA